MATLSIPQMQSKALDDPERQIREYWGKKLVQQHVKDWNRKALKAIITDDRYEPEVQDAAKAGLPKITALQVKHFVQEGAETSLIRLLAEVGSEQEKQAVANGIKALQASNLASIAVTDRVALQNFANDKTRTEAQRKAAFEALAISFVNEVRQGLMGRLPSTPFLADYMRAAMGHQEKPESLKAELGVQTKEGVLLKIIEDYAKSNDNSRLLILALLPSMPEGVKAAALKKTEAWVARTLDEYATLGWFEELGRIKYAAGVPAELCHAADSRMETAYMSAVAVAVRDGEYLKLKGMLRTFTEGPVCEAIKLGIEQAAKNAAEKSNNPALLQDITLDPSIPRQVRLDAGLGLRVVFKEDITILREIEANPGLLPEVREAFQKAMLPFDIKKAEEYVGKEVAYGHEVHSSLWKVVRDMPAHNIEPVCNAVISLCAEYIAGKPSPGIPGVDEYIAAAEPATVKANAREALIRIVNESRLPAGIWQAALLALEPLKAEPFKAPRLFRNPDLKSWFKARPEAQKRRI